MRYLFTFLLTSFVGANFGFASDLKKEVDNQTITYQKEFTRKVTVEINPEENKFKINLTELGKIIQAARTARDKNPNWKKETRPVFTDFVRLKTDVAKKRIILELSKIAELMDKTNSHKNDLKQEDEKHSLKPVTAKVDLTINCYNYELSFKKDQIMEILPRPSLLTSGSQVEKKEDFLIKVGMIYLPPNKVFFDMYKMGIHSHEEYDKHQKEKKKSRLNMKNDT